MARYQPPGGLRQRGRMPSRQLPRPDPAQRQRALAGLVLAVLSLLGLAFGLGNLRRGIYVAVLTLVFAAVAIVLGITTTRTARRRGTARPRGAVSGIVLGGFGIALSALWLLVLAVFWPQLNAYYNCMSGANTVAAQQACHNQFNKSVGGEISVLQNGRLPLGFTGLGPGVEVDPVTSGIIGLVNHMGLAGFRERRRGRGVDPVTDGPSQDQPVGGGGGEGGGDADLQHRDQADAEAGRADRGQAAVAERAAGERRAQADQQARRGAGGEAP
jgi:hypothetical protein